MFYLFLFFPCNSLFTCLHRAWLIDDDASFVRISQKNSKSRKIYKSFRKIFNVITRAFKKCLIQKKKALLNIFIMATRKICLSSFISSGLVVITEMFNYGSSFWVRLWNFWTTLVIKSFSSINIVKKMWISSIVEFDDR